MRGALSPLRQYVFMALCLVKHREGIWLHAFSTSALDGGEWLASRLGRSTPGAHWVGGWVGPRDGLWTQWGSVYVIYDA